MPRGPKGEKRPADAIGAAIPKQFKALPVFQHAARAKAS
jgi:hypothetical protein